MAEFDFKALLEERFRFETPRGRDVKKMPKPWTCRNVVHTCSNGWTIEELPPGDDHILEGFFMGHCLGGPDGSNYGVLHSLREPDGTPHATIISPRYGCIGRSNMGAKQAYVELVREWQPAAYSGGGWSGEDTDDSYHEEGKWNDEDYRDHPDGTSFRGTEWYDKRGEKASKYESDADHFTFDDEVLRSEEDPF